MKNINKYLLLILSAFLVLQCNKNEPKKNDIGYSGERITIDEIISFVPSYLLKSSVIIYKNVYGQKLELKTVTQSEVIENKIGDVVSTSESFETRLFSESDIFFNITLISSGMAWTDGSIVKALTIMLMPFHPNGNLYLTINFKDGEPSNDLLTHSELQSIELLGKTFERVFKGKKEESDSYSEIYFSPLDGIIAFRDGDNDLWVLDEVIE